jgi:hypothetical protein
MSVAKPECSIAVYTRRLRASIASDTDQTRTIILELSTPHNQMTENTKDTQTYYLNSFHLTSSCLWDHRLLALSGSARCGAGNDAARSKESSNQSSHVYCLKNILYVGSSVFSFHGYPSSDRN